MSLVNKPCGASEVEANQGYGPLDERLRREHGVELIGANRKKRRKRPQHGGPPGLPAPTGCLPGSRTLAG